MGYGMIEVIWYLGYFGGGITIKKRSALLLSLMIGCQLVGCRMQNESMAQTYDMNEVDKTEKMQVTEQREAVQEVTIENNTTDTVKLKDDKLSIPSVAWQIEEEEGVNHVAIRINGGTAIFLRDISGEVQKKDLSQILPPKEKILLSTVIGDMNEETVCYLSYADPMTLQYWERVTLSYKETVPSFRLIRQIIRDPKTGKWQLEIPKFQGVVVDNYIIGGNLYGQWVEGDLLCSFLEQKQTYELYKDGKQISGKYEGVLRYKRTDHEDNGINIENAPDYDLAIVGEHGALFPRRKEALNTASNTYQKIVSEYLKECGIEVIKPTITQIYRVDLEGDGVDEVIISASNVSGFSEKMRSEYGDYSVVLLRRIVDGEVETYPLFSVVDDYKPVDEEDMLMHSMPSYYAKLIDCIDLNGDGKLEIITTWGYYEGRINEAYAVEEDGVTYCFGGGYAI